MAGFVPEFACRDSYHLEEVIKDIKDGIQDKTKQAEEGCIGRRCD